MKRQIKHIPMEQVTGIEAMVGRMMKLDVVHLPLKFHKPFESTKEIAYQKFAMTSLVESFKIECIDSEKIVLVNQHVIASECLAEMFRDAVMLGVSVVTLHGYEEVDEAEDNMFRKLLLDSWGTAFVECGNQWMMEQIEQELLADSLYATYSFSPGQNDIPLIVQQTLFELLSPEEIGVTLSDKFMMHPKKSISGFFGIQTKPCENRVRPCDLCERRDTCPNAYLE
ncbi:MAG: hypothetical protein CVU86_01285 [Firmicutes bacterium HGW-Firmicutes-11]|jgi:hypothetical protein|nr:MAG: hypothetical protein CVU86_01285 [Firmicutes bacterium HGW-Firmicutes-11]